MQIRSPKYGIIKLAVINPDDIGGALLPASTTFFAERDFGTVLIQEFRSEHYLLRYKIFKLLKKITLFFTEEQSDLRSQYLLNGSLKIRTQGKEQVHLKKGQFILFGRTDSSNSIEFDKGKEHIIFDAECSVEMLKPLFTAFPSLKEFIDVEASSKKLRVKKNHFASPKMMQIVNDLLKCPYDQNLQKVYFEQKVNNFLFEALVQFFEIQPGVEGLEQSEKDAVFNARDIILADVAEHYTIAELSKRVRLNEFKLKTGFKKFFGVGMFEFLLQARMEKAMKLLQETDKPIKEIASLTGYTFLTNFITAFRKFYGVPPGEVRRNGA